MPTLLIVDPADGDAMRALLSGHGHDVRLEDSVADALVSLQNLMPDLVMLDHAIEPSGWLLLSKLGTTPAIVCSAQASVSDRVTSLRLGADDFIGKPFDAEELHERVCAVLRRCRPRSPRGAGTLTMGELSIDKLQVRARVNRKPVYMTATEFRLLVLLAEHVDEVLSHGQIGEAVWGFAQVGQTLGAHLGRLRHRLVSAGLLNPRLINVPSVGYTLRLEEKDETKSSEGDPT